MVARSLPLTASLIMRRGGRGDGAALAFKAHVFDAVALQLQRRGVAGRRTTGCVRRPTRRGSELAEITRMRL